MESEPRASTAVRQIELSYKEAVAGFVDEAREQAGVGPDGVVTGAMVASAHERAWRQGIVRAQRSTSPDDWAHLTVTHEAAMYQHLLGWTAAQYGVTEADVRAWQGTPGYRHHPR